MTPEQANPDHPIMARRPSENIQGQDKFSPQEPEPLAFDSRTARPEENDLLSNIIRGDIPDLPVPILNSSIGQLLLASNEWANDYFTSTEYGQQDLEQEAELMEYPHGRGQRDLRALSFRRAQKWDSMERVPEDELPESLQDADYPYYRFNQDTQEGRALHRAVFPPPHRMEGGEVHNVGGVEQYAARNKLGVLGGYAYGMTDDYQYIRDTYDFDTYGAGLLDGLSKALGTTKNIGIYDRAPVTGRARRRMEEAKEAAAQDDTEPPSLLDHALMQLRGEHR